MPSNAPCAGYQCPTCQRCLSCGCQKRVAADGAAACDACVTSYNEARLHPAAALPADQVPANSFSVG